LSNLDVVGGAFFFASVFRVSDAILVFSIGTDKSGATFSPFYYIANCNIMAL
jgi:hypothetical protein